MKLWALLPEILKLPLAYQNKRELSTPSNCSIMCKLHSNVGSGVSKPFGWPVHWFGCLNSDAQKTVFKFSFFSCISTKNTLNSDQWFYNGEEQTFLERQKGRQKRETIR